MVISSPVFATAVLALSETMLTDVAVGGELSKLTEVASVEAVTCVAGFPASSVKSSVKERTSSVVAPVVVKVAE